MVVAIAALLPFRAPAQEVPPAKPGAVVTVPVTVERSADFGSAPGYTIRAREGVQLFTPDRGTLKEEGGHFFLAVTMSLPGDMAAGTHEVARVIVERDGEAVEERAIRVRVQGEHGLDLAPETLERHASAGEEVQLPLSVENTGNVGDTVRIRIRGRDGRDWAVSLGPGLLALAPGSARPVDLSVRVPADLEVGRRYRLEVAAIGRQASDRTTVDVWISEDRGPIGGLERLPGTLFVGSGTGGFGTGAAGDVFAAYEGRTVLGSDTELSVEGRRRPRAAPIPPAFGGSLGGRDARIRLRRPDWNAAVGEIYPEVEPVAGTMRGGTGGRFRWTPGPASVDVVATYPSSGAGRTGRSLLLGADLDAGPGRVGLRVFEEDRGSDFFPGSSRIRSAGITYRLRAGGGHRLIGSTGLMSVRSRTGKVRTGPAAELEYERYGRDLSARIEARTVPGRVPGLSSEDTELNGRIAKRLIADLHATGRGFWRSSPLLDRVEDPASRGGSAGLRWSSTVLQASGEVRIRDFRNSRGFAAGDRRETSGVFSVRGPLGPLSVGGRAEIGREDFGGLEAPSHLLGIDARWSRAGAWASLGFEYEDDPAFGSGFETEVRGGVNGNRFQLEGALELDTGDRGREAVRGWGSIRYRADPKTAVVAGLERRPAPFRGAELNFSLGIERELTLPLPVPTVALASGTVFEDRNGNGRRDAGEAGVPGVRFVKGPVTAVTGPEGHYEITDRSARGARLRMVASSLPPELIVPTDVEPSAGGGVPVVRPGRVSLRIVDDADGNGAADPGEPPVEGAVVQLVDDRGRTRTAETGTEGWVRLSGLSPGTYRVSIYVPAEGRRLESEAELRVDLAWDGVVERTVPVEIRRKEIRFDVSGGGETR